MAIFEYAGTDRAGKAVRSTVDAESVKAARQKLKKTGLVILTVKEKGAAKAKSTLFPSLSGGGKVSLATLSTMTRQFASLIKANIPLVEALAALVDQTEHPGLRSALADIRQKVNEGSSLKNALNAHPKIFTPIFINMVESGESSGTLPLVLLRLADFMESQVRLRGKISSAMMYPLLMMAVGGGLMLMIFTFVIPKIAGIFVSMNRAMPWYTQLLMNFSFFLVNYWWLLFGIVGLFVWLVRRYLATVKGKAKKDEVMLKLPLFGDLVRMIAVTRFAGTLATLLKGGVPLVAALGIVKSVMDNVVLANAIVAARANITEGQSITEPLRRSGQFPTLLIHMVGIGERTGELPQMLEMVAENYEEQINRRVEGLTSLLEPLMIVAMGAAVGIIVMAVFVPLLQLQQLK
jgi:general secretion pathway protein F